MSQKNLHTKNVCIINVLVDVLHYYSTEFPRGHKVLKAVHSCVLKEFPIHMCKETIMYKGRETEMTCEMESRLCEGHNYEHTHGSVHGSKLQLLFQILSTWKIVIANYQRMFGKKVIVLFN